MAPPVQHYGREDVLAVFTTDKPTDPDSLVWAPLLGFLGNTLRLRMNITEANLSQELFDAASTLRYPDMDPPEVRGLVRVLGAACTGAGFPYRLEAGPHEMQTGTIGFFEPYKFRLPFMRASLVLYIVPQEFQWVLKGAGKEPLPWSQRMAEFQRLIQVGTQQWLRNGNR